MDDEETHPECLSNAHEPRLCSGRGIFLEIQNLEPSFPGADKEGRVEKETALIEHYIHSVCKGNMAEAGTFYTSWEWPLGNYSLEGL